MEESKTNMIEPSAGDLYALDRLMTIREVAQVTGRSVREVWREISRGRLPHPVPGRPARLFESDMRHYLENLRAERDKKNVVENGVVA